MKYTGKGWAAAWLVVALSGCGGGGGGGDGGGVGGGDAPAASPGAAPPVGSAQQAAPSAEGVFEGVLTGSTGNAFRMLVLDDGSYWMLYGTRFSNLFLARGFVQGTGVSGNGTFTSADALDFGGHAPGSGALSARYDAAARGISGSIAFASTTMTLTGGPRTDFLYDYEQPAPLASVAGDWNLVGFSGSLVALRVAADGTFTGNNSGCLSSGRLTPRASGRNVFDVVVTNGQELCLHPLETARGIAIVYPLSNGQTQLFLAAMAQDRAVTGAGFATR